MQSHGITMNETPWRPTIKEQGNMSVQSNNTPITVARRARATEVRRQRVILTGTGGRATPEVRVVTVVYGPGEADLTQIHVSANDTTAMLKAMVADLTQIPLNRFFLEVERTGGEPNVAMLNAAAMALLFDGERGGGDASSTDLPPPPRVVVRRHDPQVHTGDPEPPFPNRDSAISSTASSRFSRGSSLKSGDGCSRDTSLTSFTRGGSWKSQDSSTLSRSSSLRSRILAAPSPTAGATGSAKPTPRADPHAGGSVGGRGGTQLLDAIADVRRHLREAVDETESVNSKARDRWAQLQSELEASREEARKHAAALAEWQQKAIAAEATQKEAVAAAAAAAASAVAVAMQSQQPHADSRGKGRAVGGGWVGSPRDNAAPQSGRVGRPGVERWVESTTSASPHRYGSPTGTPRPFTPNPDTAGRCIEVQRGYDDGDDDDVESVELASILGDGPPVLCESPGGESDRPQTPLTVRETGGRRGGGSGRGRRGSDKSGEAAGGEAVGEAVPRGTRIHTATLAYDPAAGYYWPCCQLDVLTPGKRTRREYGWAAMVPGCHVKH